MFLAEECTFVNVQSSPKCIFDTNIIHLPSCHNLNYTQIIMEEIPEENELANIFPALEGGIKQWVHSFVHPGNAGSMQALQHNPCFKLLSHAR